MNNRNLELEILKVCKAAEDRKVNGADIVDTLFQVIETLSRVAADNNGLNREDFYVGRLELEIQTVRERS